MRIQEPYRLRVVLGPILRVPSIERTRPRTSLAVSLLLLEHRLRRHGHPLPLSHLDALSPEREFHRGAKVPRGHVQPEFLRPKLHHIAEIHRLRVPRRVRPGYARDALELLRQVRCELTPSSVVVVQTLELAQNERVDELMRTVHPAEPKRVVFTILALDDHLAELA